VADLTRSGDQLAGWMVLAVLLLALVLSGALVVFMLAGVSPTGLG
jgi:hypothetical protein